MSIRDRAPHRFVRATEIGLLVDIKWGQFAIPGFLIENGPRTGTTVDVDGHVQGADTMIRVGARPIDEVVSIFATGGWLPTDNNAPMPIGIEWVAATCAYASS